MIRLQYLSTRVMQYSHLQIYIHKIYSSWFIGFEHTCISLCIYMVHVDAPISHHQPFIEQLIFQSYSGFPKFSLFYDNVQIYITELCIMLKHSLQYIRCNNSSLLQCLSQIEKLNAQKQYLQFRLPIFCQQKGSNKGMFSKIPAIFSGRHTSSECHMACSRTNEFSGVSSNNQTDQRQKCSWRYKLDAKDTLVLARIALLSYCRVT